MLSSSTCSRVKTTIMLKLETQQLKKYKYYFLPGYGDEPGTHTLFNSKTIGGPNSSNFHHGLFFSFSLTFGVDCGYTQGCL